MVFACLVLRPALVSGGQGGPEFFVEGLTPRSGREGDLVTVAGGGFGRNPDDLCVVIMNGSHAIPLRALATQDNQVLARLGVVRPEAEAAPIHIMRGRGNVGTFQPVFEDIEPIAPSWVWLRDESSPGASSQQPFTPIPTAPSGQGGGAGIIQQPPPSLDQADVWFFGEVVDGQLCVFLNGDWPADTEVQIVARAHNHERGIGQDLEAPRTRFVGGGSALECAERIADIIRCAFQQQAGVDIDVQVEEQADGRVKITVKLADEVPIDWGILDVCAFFPCRGDSVRLDLEDLELGKSFGVGDVFNTGGVEVRVDTFYLTPPDCVLNPAAGGFTRVEDGRMACGNTHELAVNNVNLVLDFGGPAVDVSLLFGEFGGNVNLEINGDCRNVRSLADLNGAVVGGVLVRAVAFPLGGNCGRLALRGLVHSFRLGGQELWIDDIKFCRACKRNTATAFEDLALGSAFPHGSSFTTNGIQIDVDTFFTGPDCVLNPFTNGQAVVVAGGLACGSGAELQVNNVNLGLDFGGPARDLMLRYGEYGGNVNLEVNGDCRNVADFAVLNGLTVGGVLVQVFDLGPPGNSCGVLSLEGVATSFRIGGQELFVDDVSACVQEAVVEIVDFNPKQVRPGEIVTIDGRGFGNDPDNLCVVLKNGDRSIGLQAVQASDTQLLAVMGALPENATPGPIMVARGRGGRGTFQPAFPDIVLEERVWVWDRDPPGGPQDQTDDDLTPLPQNPPPGVVWFFGDPPVDGALCLTLRGNWIAGSVLEVVARAHDHEQGIGHDLHAFRVRIDGPGSTLDCAERICDMINCAFLQQAGITVECTTEEIEPEVVKITLRLPGGRIDWGNLDLCVSPPPQEPLTITGIEPREGGPGTVVKIVGSGFGDDPDDLCVVVMNGGLSIPLHALEASDNTVSAELGPVPPGAQPGPIMVAVGQGARGRFDPAFPDLTVGDDVWVWDRQPPNGPAVVGPGEFRPLPEDPPADTRWFFSGEPVDGALCLFIEGDWVAGAKVEVAARAHDHDQGIGHDLHALEVTFTDGGSLLDCGLRICDIIRCAFVQQANINVECSAEETEPGLVKLTLKIPNGRISWGNFRVCVTPEPVAPVVITDFAPAEGGLGDIITINGRGFGDDPDDLCVVVMNGENAVPMRALAASDTRVRVRVGAVRPPCIPGPIMIIRGQGAVGSFKPVFPDLEVLEGPWVWLRDGGPEATSQQLFTPHPSVGAGNGVGGGQPGGVLNEADRWFFGEVKDGQACVFLDGDWPAGTEVQVVARAHNHTTGIGQDLDAPRTRFVGGGSLEDCAERILDIIRCAFQQQAGVEIEAESTVLDDGRVKITVKLPNDVPIEWGILDICVFFPCPGERIKLDFEDLPLGMDFPFGTSFTSSGLTILVTTFFQDPASCSNPFTGGGARVENGGMACGAGNELNINNANLGMSFPGGTQLLRLLYGEYGGHLNLAINADCRSFDDFADVNGSVIGGVQVTAVDFGPPGNSCGRLRLDGPIETLRIGGQEFYVDELEVCLESSPAQFTRGDCDGDGEVSGIVTDAVFLLNFNFAGRAPPPCFAACDVDGDGEIRGVVTDAINLLRFNFLGGAPPPPPFPGCGPLVTPGDRLLGCETSTAGCR